MVPWRGWVYFGFHKNVGTSWGTRRYFSASGMNDHHFHYGYWLLAAARIAKRDPDSVESRAVGEDGRSYSERHRDERAWSG